MNWTTSQTGDFCVVQSTWLEGQATVPTQLLHGDLSLIQMRVLVEHPGYMMIRALNFAEVLLTCLAFLIIKRQQKWPRKPPVLGENDSWQCLTLILSHKRVLITLQTANLALSSHYRDPIRALVFEKNG